jgi:hypothetical protein
MSLTILYRGPLSSCNYGCDYCPFAKHHETDEEHAVDAAKLERFVTWCEAFPLAAQKGSLRVFFTPWGEALTQRRYHQALARLTRLPHLEKAAVQTNLSARLDWLDDVEVSKLGLWATFHPAWAQRARFVASCLELHRRGVSFSVGVVGLPTVVEELRALRAELPPDVYVWVNAVKSLAPQYSSEVLAAFTAVDPLFRTNLAAHPSLGRACAGGDEVISVDGDGVARTCHFIRAPIGNLYDEGFAAALTPRPCSAQTCGCHIGYVHLEYLGLGQVFGSGILERVPARGVRDGTSRAG